MGYTHYFQQQREITDEEWITICQDAEQILDRAKTEGIQLVYEYDQTDFPPSVTPELIRFNGVLGDGHETFYLPRKMEPGYRGETYRFNFCKTARKPYDAAVGAILISMNDHAPGAWDIASDGGREDWSGCIELYELALGKAANMGFLDPQDEEVA